MGNGSVRACPASQWCDDLTTHARPGSPWPGGGASGAVDTAAGAFPYISTFPPCRSFLGTVRASVIRLST
jgi:hypothetical protein